MRLLLESHGVATDQVFLEKVANFRCNIVTLIIIRNEWDIILSPRLSWLMSLDLG